ncbi:MAG: B12-binding domain-containing radical SAM protein, partial [Myxococcales bacterium]|nr:B12-binding domain-containing radical SAM protein [Myxococcales bacterium]
HIHKALELGYPLPGLAYNYLACMAADRRDLQSLQEYLRKAIRTDPQHFVVAQNAEALRMWLTQGGPVQNLPLHLTARHDFQIFERTKQPMLPGALPEDFAHWSPPSEPDPDDPLRSASEASQSSDQDRTRLKVVSSP